MDLKPIKSLAKRVVPYYLIRRYSLARAVPEPELRGLSRLGGPGCFIDVGANYGEWSWFAARHFKHVHAFEPIATLAALLKKTLPRNVDVHAIALSDRQGRAVLETPLVAGDQIYALASLEKNANGEVPTTASDVQLRTLDELEIHNVDAIKIDVEGHEDSTLRGARATIERERPVLVVEIEERHHLGRSEEIIASLVARDYSAFYLKGGLRSYEAGTIGELQKGPVFEADRKNPDYINNFIFIPNEKPQLRAAFF
jgi:FkbM family methyltransferase